MENAVPHRIRSRSCDRKDLYISIKTKKKNKKRPLLKISGDSR